MSALSHELSSCILTCNLTSLGYYKQVTQLYFSYLDCQDAAIRSPCGDISNPLLVLPLLPSATESGYDPGNKQAEAVNDTPLNNIVGAGYHAYEDTILKKLQKVRIL